MRVHTFPRGIIRKMNIITSLEFELPYYDDAVLHINRYTTGTPEIISKSRTAILTTKSQKLVNLKLTGMSKNFYF